MDYEKFQRYQRIAASTVYSEPEAGNFHNALIKEAIEKLFMPLAVPKDAVILDAGCGPGVFLDELTALGYSKLFGITLSPEDVTACKMKGHRVYQSDISDLGWRSNWTDFIWCRHAIEHSPYPFFTLLEFNRTLKDKGLAYIEVPTPDSLRVHEANPNHYSVLGPVMWQALFTRAGFKVEGQYELNITLKDGERSIPERYLSWVIRKCKSFPSEN